MLMLSLFALVPVAASCILGLIYLLTEESSPRVKLLICGVFLLAAYLQFASRFSLLGLLLQAALAAVLAIWWKLETSA